MLQSATYNYCDREVTSTQLQRLKNPEVTLTTNTFLRHKPSQL